MSNRSVIENIYAGIAEWNLDPMFEVLAADAQWFEAENIPYSPGKAIVGHEEVQRVVFAAHDRDFEKFSVNVIRISAGENTVLVQGRYVGTTKAGKKLDSVFAHVWDFEGDVVVRFQQYSDTWQWRRVLGVDD
jgi:hypothetical protein